MVDGFDTAGGGAAAPQMGGRAVDSEKEVLRKESELAALHLKSIAIEYLVAELSKAKQGLIDAEAITVKNIEDRKFAQNLGVIVSLIFMSLAGFLVMVPGLALINFGIHLPFTTVAFDAYLAAGSTSVFAVMPGLIGIGTMIGSQFASVLRDREKNKAEDAYKKAKEKVDEIQMLLKNLTEPKKVMIGGKECISPLDVRNYFRSNPDISTEKLQKSVLQSLNEVLNKPDLTTLMHVMSNELHQELQPHPGRAQSEHLNEWQSQERTKLISIAQGVQRSAQKCVNGENVFNDLRIEVMGLMIKTEVFDGIEDDKFIQSMRKIQDLFNEITAESHYYADGFKQAMESVSDYDSRQEADMDPFKESLALVRKHMKGEGTLPLYLNRASVVKQMKQVDDNFRAHHQRIRRLEVNPVIEGLKKVVYPVLGVAVGLAALSSFIVSAGGVAIVLSANVMFGIAIATFAVPAIWGIVAAFASRDRGQADRKYLQSQAAAHQVDFNRTNYHKSSPLANNSLLEEYEEVLKKTPVGRASPSPILPSGIAASAASGAGLHHEAAAESVTVVEKAGSPRPPT